MTREPARFDLATPADDAALRALLRAMPVPGTVTLAATREPAFFAADAALGERVETLVARERPGAEPVAVVQRAVRTVYVGGTPARVAYIGGLRVRPGHRTAALVGRGWSALRDLDRADPVAVTTISVTDANDRVRRLVSARRGAAPLLDAVAALVTLALVVRPRGRPARPGLAVVPDDGRAAALRAEAGPGRDLFPVRLALPGVSETLVALRDGTAVGAVTVWDPSAVRQQVVHAYRPGLARARPLLNALARVGNVRPLPPPGEALAVAFAAGLVARDAAALDALLDAALARAHRLGMGFLLVGFDRTDPLLARARRRLHLAYPSTLFAACDDLSPALRPGGPPVHAEVATY